MSQVDNSDSDDDLLIAEYVLGVLPHGERLVLARRIEVEPDLRQRLEAWEERLAPLGQALEPVAPPPQLLGAIERRLFGESPRAPGLWQSLGFWRGLAAALFALLVIGTGVAVTWLPRGGAPAGGYVAELSGTAAPVKLAAFYDAKTGVLRLNRLAGDAPQGRVLQLWLIAGSNPPQSLGVLPGEAMTVLQLPPAAAASLAPNVVLAVSEEPPGGSPTGLPTGAVLASGPLNAI